MPSRTQPQALPTPQRKACLAAATPERGDIVDIGASCLRGVYVNKLKDTLAAIAEIRASTLQPEDHLLFGMDVHLVVDHRDKIRDTYHSCDDVFRNFFVNGLRNANKLLGYNLFDERDRDFMAELKEEPTTRHRFFICAKKDIPMDKGNVISKGQEIDWLSSHKYESRMFVSCAARWLDCQYLVRPRTKLDEFEDHDSGISGVN
ncbi:hypothetical protein PWT90_08512 [Aphanocladium album]|nr:hypothetical protein PWT90_08512 [Aphanocladium album]